LHHVTLLVTPARVARPMRCDTSTDGGGSCRAGGHGATALSRQMERRDRGDQRSLFLSSFLLYSPSCSNLSMVEVRSCAATAVSGGSRARPGRRWSASYSCSPVKSSRGGRSCRHERSELCDGADPAGNALHLPCRAAASFQSRRGLQVARESRESISICILWCS